MTLPMINYRHLFVLHELNVDCVWVTLATDVGSDVKMKGHAGDLNLDWLIASVQACAVSSSSSLVDLCLSYIG